MERVPAVDFAPFLSGTPAGKQAVADAVGAACEGIGFFYLANHGMSASVTDGILPQRIGSLRCRCNGVWTRPS